MKIVAFGLLISFMCLSFHHAKSNTVIDIIGSMENKNTTAVSERVFQKIDRVENFFGTIWKWTRSHRQVVKSAIGAIILFYGGHFTKTILFYQAISVTGLPLLTKSLSDLSISYRDARNALRKELPDILKAEAEMATLLKKIENEKEEIKTLESKLSSNKITRAEFDKKFTLSTQTINAIQKTIHKTHAIQDSFSHLKEAMHPEHLQGALGSLYQSTIIGMAAISSQSLATITRGLHIGKVAYERASKFFKKRYILSSDGETIINDLDEGKYSSSSSSTSSSGRSSSNSNSNTKKNNNNIATSTTTTTTNNMSTNNMSTNIANTDLLLANAKWLKSSGKLLARALGVIIAFTLDHTIATITTCSIGSHILIDGLEDLLDPWFSKADLPTFASSPQTSTFAHTALFVLGVRNQLLGGKSADLPIILKVVLSPIIAFEFFLNNGEILQNLF